MGVLISKKQAVQIVGSEENLQKAVKMTLQGSGESHRLFSGAKLFVTRQGAVRRYGIYGYDEDGSDVREVFEALEAGESPLLFGSRRRNKEPIAVS